MADDEGRDRRSEDLFEDLDKFFAPIQDVDWPEEGAAPEVAGPADERPADERPAAEEPAAPEVLDDPLDQPIPWEEPATAAPGPEVDDLLAPEPERPAEPAPEGFGSAHEPERDELPEPTAGSSETFAEDMFGPGSDLVAEAPEVGEGADMFASDERAGGAAAGTDDLLPEGWATGLDDAIDLDVDVPPPGAGDEPPAGRFLGEPTAEMSGEDWAELQAGAGAAGEPFETEPAQREPYSYMEQFMPDQGEPEVPEFGYGPDPGAGATPAGGTTGIDWDEPAAASGPASLEDSGPISIDDLRRAPDAYRDLPGPDADEPLGPAIPGFGDEDVAAGAVLGLDEEPAAGDVEAAAEHFAASIREEEPDLGLTDSDPFAFATGMEAGAAAAGDPFADEPLDAAAGEPGDVFGTEAHREPYSDQPEPLVFPGEGDDEADDLLAFGEPGGPRTVKVGSAEEAGPSWQEPTSVDVPVEGEQEPPRPGRNLSAAILTGVALAAIAAVALLLGKVWFAFVAGAVIALAQVELYTAVRKRGYQPAVPLGLAVGVLISWAGYTNGEAGILAMTAVGALFTPIWYMAIPAAHRKNVTANIGMTLFGIMAVPFLGGFAMAIIHLASRAFTIVVLALAFGFDIVAYAVGTWTGQKPLAPTISPNKTREGAYAGFGVLAIMGFAFVGNISPLDNVWQGVGLAIAAGFAAMFGDLAESLVKRDLGVKDMGAIFPGHGGALDRIDSILFVAPVAYYFIRLFVF